MIQVRELWAVTYLHLARPEVFRRVVRDATRPVALYADNHVVAAAVDALGDDTKAMVLSDGAPTDASEQTLLDPALELDNGCAGRWLIECLVVRIGMSKTYLKRK